MGAAGGAHAATGELTFAQCFDDADRNLEGAKCANAPGLFGARSVAVTRDGKSVYAASVWDDAIVRFNRNTNTGALAFAQCFDDEDTGEGAACSDAPGLNGPQSVAVSADGISLYLASEGDSAIVRFDRNTATGALDFAECFVDEDDPSPEDGCTAAPGLFGAQSVAASPDGESLYAATAWDEAVVRFNRNTTTGALEFAECFVDEDAASPEEGCTAAPGLFGAESLAVSADGASLYVASLWDYAIVRFNRDTTSGALAFAQCFDDEDDDLEGAKCADAPGLFGATSVTVSEDGGSVYAASVWDDAIVRFDRNTATGALAFAQCFDDEDADLEGAKCTNAPGLFGAQSVAASRDGRSLYAASAFDGAIARFNRNTNTGALAFAQCIDDEDENLEGAKCPGAPGLYGAQSVAVSGDGKSLYAASEFDDAVARFNRELLPPPSPPSPPSAPPSGDGQPPPSNEFEFGRLKRNKKRGTAKLFLNVPGPGGVELAKNRKVRGREKRAEAAGRVKLPVKPTRRAKRRLAETGRARVRAEVEYTPDGGRPNAKAKRVKLVKR